MNLLPRLPSGAINTRRLILAAVAVSALALGLCGWRCAAERQEAEHQAALAAETRRAQDAEQREAEAKAEARAAGAMAAQRERERDALQARLDALPRDPGPRPVDPGTAAPAALSELVGMGLHPVVLGSPLAAGLTLPDTLTAIQWGREAQRVGPLVERLDTATALARAQAGISDARLLQVAHLTTALGAADERATAQERRADAAEALARDRGPLRPWRAGLLGARDWQGRSYVGGYVGWSYRRVDLQVVQVGDRTALGAGWRW
jgi:hypothetical protein